MRVDAFNMTVPNEKYVGDAAIIRFALKNRGAMSGFFLEAVSGQKISGPKYVRVAFVGLKPCRSPRLIRRQGPQRMEESRVCDERAPSQLEVMQAETFRPRRV